MSIIEKYEKIRDAGRTLIYSMLDACVTKEMLQNAAKLLGITLQGDEFVFDSEEETSVLMDFVLLDYKVNDSVRANAVQVYRETRGGQNKVENEILDSLLASYTSLFEVVAVSGYTLLLKDLFRIMDKPIKLMDLGFSGCAIPGMLIFSARAKECGEEVRHL